MSRKVGGSVMVEEALETEPTQRLKDTAEAATRKEPRPQTKTAAEKLCSVTSDGRECRLQEYKNHATVPSSRVRQDGERVWHQCIQCWSAKSEARCDTFDLSSDAVVFLETLVH